MAYYDPYSSNDSYYNPVNNTQQSAVGSIASFAGKMIGYSILQGAASAAISFAGKGIAKGVGSVGSKASPYISKLNTLNKEKLGFSNLFRANDKGSKLYSSVQNSAKPYVNAYNDRKAMLSQASTTDAFASRERLTSIFKNKETAIGTIGAFTGKHILQGSVVSYAFDNFTGSIGDYGLEQKAVYDLPGHISNYTKYLGKSATSVAAFGAIGPAFSTLKGAAGQGYRNVFDSN